MNIYTPALALIGRLVALPPTLGAKALGGFSVFSNVPRLRNYYQSISKNKNVTIECTVRQSVRKEAQT